MGGRRFYCHREGRGSPRVLRAAKGPEKHDVPLRKRPGGTFTRFSDRFPRFTSKKVHRKRRRKTYGDTLNTSMVISQTLSIENVFFNASFVLTICRIIYVYEN